MLYSAPALTNQSAAYIFHYQSESKILPSPDFHLTFPCPGPGPELNYMCPKSQRLTFPTQIIVFDEHELIVKRLGLGVWMGLGMGMGMGNWNGKWELGMERYPQSQEMTV